MTTSCSSSSCACKPTYSPCEGRCALNGLACNTNGAAACGVWDFETTLQGVSLNTQTTGRFKTTGASSMSVTLAPGGTRSFTVPYSAGAVVVLKIPLCTSRGGIAIYGHQLSARIRVDGAAGGFVLPYFQAFAFDSAGSDPPGLIDELDNSITVGQWTSMTQTASGIEADSTAKELDILINTPTEAGGTVYVDDIRVQ